MRHVPTLQKLLSQLQHVPYVASKNLYRVASYFLTADKKKVESFCQALLDLKEHVVPCKTCFHWTEGAQLCDICACSKRDHTCICVVETWHDLLAIEKAQEYTGVYHVLGGSLCPLEGIGPDNLTIRELLHRLDDVSEIIFATNPTPEGEATASFIASKIHKSDMKISRLASGVPIGSSLEYMDRVTIHKALSGRQPF